MPPNIPEPATWRAAFKSDAAGGFWRRLSDVGARPAVALNAPQVAMKYIEANVPNIFIILRIFAVARSFLLGSNIRYSYKYVVFNKG
jgi:hypothetical protein